MKISIITVTYNSSRTIEDTIKSVLQQSYKDYEYLVIDGGSQDETIDIIKSYEPEFNGRLRWISESDKGMYDAMNKGIKMASGDVVGILNSDDYYTTANVLSEIVKVFADSNIDAVYGDIHFIRDGQPERCVRYYSSRLFHRRWLRYGFMPAHPSFYARHTIYDNAGLYKTDYKIGADYEMMVRLFHGHRIKAKYLPMDFVTMRTGGASTRNVQSRLTLIKEDVRACRENGLYTNSFLISIKFFYKVFGLRLSLILKYFSLTFFTNL